MNILRIKPNTPFTRALMWVARAAGERSAASLQCVRISRDPRECLDSHDGRDGVILEATDGRVVHAAHVPDIDISDLWVREIALGDREPVLVPHQAIAQCATSVVHLTHENDIATWWADEDSRSTMPSTALTVEVGDFPSVDLFHETALEDFFAFWVDTAALAAGIKDSNARSVIMSDDDSLPHHLCCPTDDGEKVMLSWLSEDEQRDVMDRCASFECTPRLWDAESLERALQGVKDATFTIWPAMPYCQMVTSMPEYADITLVATVKEVPIP